ncbi:MAG: porin [Geminicoccaceae bacterium]
MSASMRGPFLGTLGLLAGLGTAKADGIEILAGGELRFGVTTAGDDLLSEGQGDRGYTFFADSELNIEADVSPSNALEIGAKAVLDVDADIDDVNADETYMFMKGGFGLVEVGRTAGAEDQMALGADTIAAGTGGIDGDAANLGEVKIVNSEDAAKISYFSPRAAGFQAGLSFTPDTGDDEGGTSNGSDEEVQDLEDHIGLGLNFVTTLGEIEVGLAAVGSYGNGEASDQNDLDAFSVGGTLAVDGIEVGASYGESKGTEDFDFATLGATFSFGPARAGLGYHYLDEKVDDITHITVLSADLIVMDGVALQADVSHANPKDQRSNTASVFAVELSF